MELSSLTNKVHYHNKLDFTPKSTDVVIIDESDVFIFNEPSLLDNTLTEARCICFTATSLARKSVKIEDEVLNDLGFEHFRYWPLNIP